MLNNLDSHKIRRVSRIASGLFVVLAVLSLFGRTLNFGFIEHDDDRNIYENPRMLHITADNLAAYWKEPYLGLYIPATYMYWTAATVASSITQDPSTATQPHPTVFHAGNIALHAINSLLVLALLRALGLGRGPALFGALLFAVHPLQVEAVAWASGAKDLLSTFWGLLSLLLFSRYLDTLKSATASQSAMSSRRDLWLYVISVAAFLLAILCKPSQLVLPILYAMMIYLRIKSDALKQWRLMMPHAALVLLYFRVANASQGAEGTFKPVALWARPLIAGDAITFYATKLVAPVNLAIDYARHPVAALSSGEIWITGILPYLVIAGLGYQTWRTRAAGWSMALICALVFVIALIPALGFLPFGYQFFSTVCDRYAYMAMTAPALALAVVLARYKDHAQITLPVTLGALTLLGLVTLKQLSFWTSEFALFNHSLSVQPAGAVALVGMSNDQAKKGDWQATIPLLEKASISLPDWARPHNNLGTSYVNLNRYEDAAAALAQAIKLRPVYPLALSNRCSVLRELNRLAEAREDCRTAISQAPDFYPAYLNLALTEIKLGSWVAARTSFAKALALNPTNYDAIYFWASALRDHGDLTAAEREFYKLKTLYPNSDEAARELATTLRLAGKSIPDTPKPTQPATDDRSNL